MFTLNNNTIELRNLIEQVQKNKEDIANHYNIDRVLADFGIRIIGQVSDASQLPDPATFTGDYGDAYAVGQSEPYSFYIWTRADVNSGHPNDYWFDIGPLAIIGPKGPKGDKGDKGDKGTPAKWISAGTQPILTGELLDGTQLLNTSNGNVYEASSYPNGSRYWKLTGNIRGPQGIQGIQGATGPQGERGPQGSKGDKGDVGGFINILGIVENTSQLPTPSSLNNLSKAYLVGTQEPYNLYIQIGLTPAQAIWKDMGQLNVATYVTVDGQFQNIWDADTKLDKVSTAASRERIYAVSLTGEPKMISLTNPGTAEKNSIPIYNGGGRIQTSKPVGATDCANKQYVDESKQLYRQEFLRYYSDDDYLDVYDKLVLITNNKYAFQYTIKNAGDYFNPQDPDTGKYQDDYKGIYFDPNNEFIIKAYHYYGDPGYPKNFTITEGTCTYGYVNEVNVDEDGGYIGNTAYNIISTICGINLDDFFGGKPQTAIVTPI